MSIEIVDATQCSGCGEPFEVPAGPGRRQKFCHKNCRTRWRWRRPLWLPLPRVPVPLTRHVIDWREDVLARLPEGPGAKGYRLYSYRLDLWLPLPGLTKRWRGSMSDAPYFALEPFEIPRVPINGSYWTVIVMKNGLEVPVASNDGGIIIDFCEDMSHYERVRQAMQKARAGIERPTALAEGSRGRKPDPGTNEEGED